MRYFIAIVLLLGVFTASAQKNKFKGAGFDYTKTAPNYIPVRGTESEIAIDSLTGKWMQYSYQSAEWWHLGYFVTETGTSGSPSYTPNKVKSVMAINAGDSLYHYRSGTWYLIAGGGGGAGITDGDKGDVDVIGGGVVWTIDTGAVTMIKINQDGAAVGQVIKWNGTAWAPANDNTLSAGAGGIYGPSDLVTYHHTATVDSGLTFSSAEDTAYFNIIMAPGAFGSAAYFNSDSIRMRRYDVGGSNEVILNSDGVLLKTTTPDRVTIQGADARYAADYRATYSDRSLIDKKYSDDFYLQEVDSLRVSNDTLYISLARDSVPEKFVVLPASDDTSGYNLDFRISNDTLYIEDADGALFVDLDPYKDNTDTSGYNLGARISGDTLYIRDGDGEVAVELPADSDGQTLSIDSVSLESGERFIITISNGNAISFDIPADTDNQTLDTLDIASNFLRASLTDDGVPFKSVDLAPYLDNTDTSGYNQDFRISNDSLYIRDGDGELFVNLDAYRDTIDVGIINALDYGVTGDGVTDDSDSLQAAIDAAAGKRLWIPSGRYVISSELTVASNTEITMSNATIDMSAQAPAVSLGGSRAFNVSGTSGTSTLVGADIALSATDITVASTTGFSDGDMVEITSTEPLFPGYSNRYKGWVTIIDSVLSSTVVRIANVSPFAIDAVGGSYTATLKRFNPVKNVTIKGGRVIGGGLNKGHTGIYTSIYQNVNIEGVVIDSCEAAGVWLGTGIQGAVKKCQILNTTSPEYLATLGYGVLIGSGYGAVIENNYFERCRHSVASGGTPTPFNAIIKDNYSYNCGLGTNDYDCHAATIGFVFENNTTHAGPNGRGGFVIRSIDAVLKGNHVYGGSIGITNADGITPGADGPLGRITLTDNVIKNNTSGYGIDISGSGVSYLSITGGSIENCSLGIRATGATAGIKVTGVSFINMTSHAMEIDDCVGIAVSNCTFDSTTICLSTLSTCTDVSMSNCVAKNVTNSLISTYLTDNIVVSNCTVSGVTSASAMYFNRSNNVAVTNCKISMNSTSFDAIRAWGSSATAHNITAIGNKATGSYKYGLYCFSNSDTITAIGNDFRQAITSPIYTPDATIVYFFANANHAWDHGDIDEGGTGPGLTIDTSAVTSLKILDATIALADMASNSIDSTKIINSGVSVLDIGQHGAASGQILKWNGTQWAPGADDTGGAGAGQNNVGENLGAGTGVYAGKTDTTLQFKSLLDGYGIDLSSTGTDITIAADTAQLATLHDVAVVQGDIDSHESADGDLDDTNELQTITLDSAIVGSVERFELGISGANSVFWDVPQTGGGDILNGGNTTGATVVVGTNDPQSFELETNGTTFLSANSSGNVGIGTSPGGMRLAVNITDASTSGTPIAMQVKQTLSPGSNTTISARSLNMSNYFNAAGINFTGNPQTAWFENRIINAGDISGNLYGIYVSGLLMGSDAATLGTASNVAAIHAIPVTSFSNSISGTITTARGILIPNSSKGSLTMTNQVGLNIAALSAGTNNTALLMGTNTAPSGNFGIYSTITDASYFAGTVGVGTASPDASALLDIVTTTKGLGLPSMTTTQRNAISAPRDGLVVYDNTLDALYLRANGVWVTTTDTDNQTLDTFEIVSNILRASLTDDGVPFKSVDLSSYLDNTDEQDLSIDSVSITGKERFTIDITNGTSISFDVDINTDTQDLSIDSASTTGGQNFTIGLTDGGSVSLFVPTDTDTDEQTLVLDSTDLVGIERYELEITGGNTVYFDDDDRQTLDTFEIVSDILRASATEDGVPFKSVDLSPYVNTAIASNQIAYGTGTDITSSFTAKVNTTSTDFSGIDFKIRVSGENSSYGALVGDSLPASEYGIALSSITNSSTPWYSMYAKRTGGGTGDILSTLENSSANTSADATFRAFTQTTGGDPMYQTAIGASVVSVGMDNSDSDLWKVDYASALDGTYAIGVNSSNQVGVGGPPISGKVLTVTGEARITDLAVTSFTPIVIVGADSDGDLGSIKLGTGLSFSNDTLNAGGTDANIYTTDGNIKDGGTIVDVSGNDPVILALDNATTEQNRMLRLTFDFTDDVTNTYGISFVGPNDSLEIRSYDSGMYLDYEGVTSSGEGFVISSNTVLDLRGDSILVQTLPTITTLPFMVGLQGNTLSKIEGTTDGQVLVWDETNGGFWEIGTSAGADGDGIYDGSGTIAAGAIATLASAQTFAIAYDGGNEAIYVDDAGYVLIGSKDAGTYLAINNGGSLLTSDVEVATSVEGNVFEVNANQFVFTADTGTVRLTLFEPSGSGTNYTMFTQPAMAASQIYALPTDAPANGDVLSWSTGGTLSWEAGGGADGDGIYDGDGTLQAGATNATLPASGILRIEYNGGNAGLIVDDGNNATTILSKDGTQFVSADNTQVIIGSGTSQIEYIDGVLKLYDSDATQSVSIQPPATGTLTTSYTLTLPADDGTSGQVLQTDGAGVLSWATAGGGAVATDAIWDAKGDLAVGTGANTGAKLTVGANGKQIYADSGESTGLRWGPDVISPSQITADQDDYAPTGWADAQIVRLDGDNGMRAITSMAAGYSGEIKQLINVGSYPIYFPGQHPDGTAANRIDASTDFILFPKLSARIMYDGTSSRWRILDAEGSRSIGKTLYYQQSVGSPTAADNDKFVWGSTAGSVGVSAPSSPRPARYSLSTVTSTTGHAWAGFSKATGNEFSVFEDAHIWSDYHFWLDDLSDGTETYTVTFSISSDISTGGAPNNTVGIRYSHGTNSGKFQGFSRDNSGSETTVDLGVTVAADTPYTLRVEIDKSKTEARFYLDGIMCGRVAANMPNAVNASTGCNILKSAGTTARILSLFSMSAGAIYP
jgi:hypothetical protein|nr:MAG TPA: Right handed beta helix region [Crassvirales sp.]